MNLSRMPVPCRLILLLLPLAASAFSAEVADSFKRANSDTVGVTETGNQTWVEVNEKAPNAVGIDAKSLSLNYNAGPSHTAALRLGAFRQANVDIQAKVNFWYAGKGRRASVCYRLDSAESDFRSAGYHAMLSSEGVVLAYGKKVLAEKAVAVTHRKWHTVRVVASGQNHKVYVDDELQLDVNDATQLAEGYMGFAVFYQSLRVSDFSVTTAGAEAATKGDLASRMPWPAGDAFPLLLYSCAAADDFRAVLPAGWNVVHTYGDEKSQNPFRQACAEAGMPALVHLPGQDKPIPEAEARAALAALSGNDFVAWWDLPEERRWWRTGEMELITTWFEYTRKFDPKKRPVYMYIPGHYTAEGVSKYVPYLDIVPASVYTTYSRMPHAWVRWRMEETVKGIRMAKADIGKDYLNGQKTPLAVLELFYHQSKDDKLPPVRVMTPEGAYHDFWQAIVSGAQGIGVFSYFHRRDLPQYAANWRMYMTAAAQLTGPEQLDRVALHGETVEGVTVSVIGGATRTVEFIPHGTKEKPVSYPAVDLLVKRWNGYIYLFAVNSAEAMSKARFSGLPATAQEAALLFTDKTLPVKEGQLDAEFGPLGVHILKIKE